MDFYSLIKLKIKPYIISYDNIQNMVKQKDKYMIIEIMF